MSFGQHEGITGLCNRIRRGRLRRYIALGVASSIFALSACDAIFPLGSNLLPRALGSPKLLAAGQISGFREGCSYAAFKLSDDVLSAIKEKGLIFLNSDTDISYYHDRNPYGSWQSTPIIEMNRIDYNGDIYAIQAEGGCSLNSLHSVNVENLARNFGSFYQITRNKEGMIFISPEHGVVIYLYFG